MQSKIDPTIAAVSVVQILVVATGLLLTDRLVAVVVEPDAPLLDQPLSNLDARLRHDVRLKLRRLRKTLNITKILATHDTAGANVFVSRHIRR